VRACGRHPFGTGTDEFGLHLLKAAGQLTECLLW
jgi:hypothetical protein